MPMYQNMGRGQRGEHDHSVGKLCIGPWSVLSTSVNVSEASYGVTPGHMRALGQYHPDGEAAQGLSLLTSFGSGPHTPVVLSEEGWSQWSRVTPVNYPRESQDGRVV